MFLFFVFWPNHLFFHSVFQPTYRFLNTSLYFLPLCPFHTCFHWLKYPYFPPFYLVKFSSSFKTKSSILPFFVTFSESLDRINHFHFAYWVPLLIYLFIIHLITLYYSCICLSLLPGNEHCEHKNYALFIFPLPVLTNKEWSINVYWICCPL